MTYIDNRDTHGSAGAKILHFTTFWKAGYGQILWQPIYNILHFPFTQNYITEFAFKSYSFHEKKLWRVDAGCIGVVDG
jgi:hypothetical protein